MRLAVTAMALAMMFGSAPVHAAESPLMAMFDTDHNNCVSLAEYQAYMDQGFRRMDANGDGILQAAEMSRGNHHHAPLTLQQRRRDVARQFHRQDTDHDACLRLKELMAPPR